MLKFLRKYKNWVLAVGGIFLMVSFLLPQAIQQCATDPGERTALYLAGRRVRMKEYGRVSGELAVLDRLGLRSPVLRPDTDLPAHWLMLLDRARRGGFLAEGEDIDEVMRALSAQRAQALYQAYGRAKQQHDMAAFMGGLTDSVREEIMSLPGLEREEGFKNLALDYSAFQAWAQQNAEAYAPSLVEQSLSNLASQMGGRVEDVRRAISGFAGVTRMLNAYMLAPRVSDRRALVEGRRIADAVFVDYVHLEPGRGLFTLPEVTDAEVDAHIEKYRDVEPGAGDHAFGYRRPPRVRIEYLTIDRAAIEALIAVDPVEANVRYRRDRDRFRRSFADERATIERELKDERVSQIMDRAQQIIRTEVLSRTGSLPIDGRYRRLPPDWNSIRPTMELLAQTVQAQLLKTESIAIPLPEVRVLNAAWQTREDLGALGGISNASVRLGSNPLRFADLVLSVKELGGAGPIALQAGIPVVEQPLTDFAQNRYYVTVLDARAASPPDSPDEVRETARNDLRRLRGYEAIASRVDDFRRVAVERGLEGLIAAESENWPDGFPPSTPPPSPDRTIEIIPGVRVTRASASDTRLDVASIRDRAFVGAAGAATSEAVASRPLEGRVIVEASPSSLGVIVGVVSGVEPITVESFREQEATIAQSAIERDLAPEGVERTSVIEPFSIEKLSERFALKYPKAAKPDDKADSDG